MYPLTSSLALKIIILSWLFVGLACIAIGVIIVWRVRVRRHFVLSDCFTLASFTVGLLLVSLTTWAIFDEGGGRHQSDLPRDKIAALAKSLIASEALWTSANTLMRMSACCTFYDLFRPVSAYRYTWLTILSLCIIHGLCSVLEVLLICRPLAAQWDPNVQGACGNQTTSFLVVELLGLGLDVVVFIVPVAHLWAIRTTLKNKLWAILSFNIGALVLIITGLRLQALYLANSPDFTYSKSYLGLLSAMGCMLSIFLCASSVVAAYIRTRKQLQVPRFGVGYNVRLGTRHETALASAGEHPEHNSSGSTLGNSHVRVSAEEGDVMSEAKVNDPEG